MRHGQDDHSLHSPQFDMKQHQFKYKPPRQQIQPEYGQSPSYVQYQHPNSHMNQGQMPAMSPASFHPSMGYNGNPPPATFHQPHHYGFVPAPNGHFFMYPDHPHAGPHHPAQYAGYNPYANGQLHPHSGQSQMNWAISMGQPHGYQPQKGFDPSQQRVMPPEMQGWIPNRFGQGGKHSQVSEDDLSTGIYEEAKHQLPNALMELDRPRKHA